MAPKVSIIIPVYNVEQFLPRCLDSVVGQTLKEIEIICVNDGSPDHSIDILQQYAACDDRILVISQENRGLGGARNRGFEAARGEYILYVDSDDWIDPDYCRALYDAARDADADIACASMLKIRSSYSKWTVRFDIPATASDAREKFRICHCPPNFHVMNKLMRREMLIRLGLRFGEQVCYEDVEYTMRVLGEGGVLVTVPGIVYRYMVNATSITKSRQTPKKQLDKYLAHKSFVSYMDAHRLPLGRKFRNITRRMYGFMGITWLKIKEKDGTTIVRLFDLIPIWITKNNRDHGC